MHKLKRKTAQLSQKHDRTLLGLIGFMLVFGIVMIHNATVVYSQDLFGGAYRFVFLQLAWIFVGLLGFIFFYNFDYQKIEKIAYPLMALTLVPLVLLAFMGFLEKVGAIPCSNGFIFAPCLNGAFRWLYLNPAPLPRIPMFGLLGFQPSELAKFATILYLAVQINKTIKQGNSFMIYLVVAGLVSFLVLMQPNMSTAALIFLIATSMYFSSGAPLAKLFITLPLLGVFSVVFMFTSSYRRDRLMTLFNNSSGTDLSLGYHIKQILIALGSGGIMGVGFGQSRQKFQYLPEVSSDSIFAIIGEEMGFIGTVFVIALFGFLIYKGVSIAKRAPDLLGRLLAVGMTSWIGLQFFVNVAAMTKMIPLTGVPIPLISYGGSSLFFSLMGLGILANVGRKEV